MKKNKIIRIILVSNNIKNRNIRLIVTDYVLYIRCGQKKLSLRVLHLDLIISPHKLVYIIFQVKIEGKKQTKN